MPAYWGRVLEVTMNKIHILSLAVILLASLTAMWACGQPPAPQTPPQPPTGTTPAQTTTLQQTIPGSTTPPAPVQFQADGIIQPGEYPNNQTYDDYQIYWNNDEQYVYIAMKAKTTGFVAVGIEPGVTMLDADIILGFVKDGKAQVFDMYSTGNFGPHPQDTDLGGMYNILASGGTEDGQYTTIEFKRDLNTGDKYDNPLVKGVNKIIWAYGPDKDPNIKHSNRGFGQIEIK
jgi:hypothetical protein